MFLLSSRVSLHMEMFWAEQEVRKRLAGQPTSACVGTRPSVGLIAKFRLFGTGWIAIGSCGKSGVLSIPSVCCKRDSGMVEKVYGLQCACRLPGYLP